MHDMRSGAPAAADVDSVEGMVTLMLRLGDPALTRQRRIKMLVEAGMPKSVAKRLARAVQPSEKTTEMARDLHEKWFDDLDRMRPSAEAALRGHLQEVARRNKQ